MIYPPDLLDILQAAAVSTWSGAVYRHMFGSYPPHRRNTAGARWNPPNVGAIYTSCERETALAEADYYISLQPLRPKAQRTLYTIRTSLANVIDLTAPDLLARLGLSRKAWRLPITSNAERSAAPSLFSASMARSYRRCGAVPERTS